MTQESLKLAVKDLERSESALHKARAAIKEALAQPEQEPVAIPDCGEAGHADGACGNRECLPSFRRNTTPPQRTWVGLTDEEIEQIGLSSYIKVVRETEAKLKQKNMENT